MDLEEMELQFDFSPLADKFSVQCERQGLKLDDQKGYNELIGNLMALWLNNVTTTEQTEELIDVIIEKAKRNDALL